MNTPTDRYKARMRAVLEFIDAHLDEPLPIDRLSAIAAFSKFHFHRQFGALLGTTVHQYVSLIRLRRASFQLAFREDSILEIAHASGYEGPEAFSRAYKKALGQAPSEFRRHPRWEEWYALQQRLNALRSAHMPMSHDLQAIDIIDFPGVKIATLEHRGDPRQLGESIRTFIEWRRRTGLHPRHSATYNLLYDDPNSVQPAEYRFDLAAATPDDVQPNVEGVVTRQIPAGRCARLRVRGGDSAMANAVRFLYSEWLPASAEELRDFPLFIERVTFFPDVPEHEQVVDVYLPLSPRSQ